MSISELNAQIDALQARMDALNATLDAALEGAEVMADGKATCPPACPAGKTSDPQQRFFDELLAKYPRLVDFWDRGNREFQDEAAEVALMGRLSRGEAVVLKALASIWLGCAHSAYQLDLTDLAALSPEWRKPLVQWIANPFFP